MSSKFKLPDSFLADYVDREVEWGYGALSETVFLRSYSQLKPNGTKERWWECCRRVIEAMFDIQKQHCKTNKLPWNQPKALRSAKEAYARMFEFKWTPPGRGLARMGTPILDKLGGMALNSCAFIDTTEIPEAVDFLMDASMLGVGVGFNTAAAGKYTIQKPRGVQPHVVEDSREGWVAAGRAIVEAYVIPDTPKPIFDYNEIRPAGSPISSGGVAPGRGPLETLCSRIESFFEGRVGELLTRADVVDIFNCIGACTVAGGNRRSALIAMDEGVNDDFLDLKNFEKNPYRQAWAYSSNNSVDIKIGDDLSALATRIAHNGEPGVIYMDVARKYGRLVDGEIDYDTNITGVNPCSEVGLESYELCCLGNVNLNRHESMADFIRTIKFAFMYTKCVTLLPTHREETNAVVLKNRRIGLSLGGVTDFVDLHHIRTFREWADRGYKALRQWDKVYSEWLCVRESIKYSSLKPDGNTSSVSGESPGAHWTPGGRYYIRRANYAASDPILDILGKAGYPIVQSAYEPSLRVVEFPTKSKSLRADDEVSLFEKVWMAAELQEWWSDNLVSCTASFDPETEADQVLSVLSMYEGKLKAISFLPRDSSVYPQMPYEKISEEECNRRLAEVSEPDFSSMYEGTMGSEAQVEAYCTTDACLAPEMPGVADPEGDVKEVNAEVAQLLNGSKLVTLN